MFFQFIFLGSQFVKQYSIDYVSHSKKLGKETLLQPHFVLRLEGQEDKATLLHFVLYQVVQVSMQPPIFFLIQIIIIIFCFLLDTCIPSNLINFYFHSRRLPIFVFHMRTFFLNNFYFSKLSISLLSLELILNFELSDLPLIEVI